MLCFTVTQCPAHAVFHSDAMSNKLFHGDVINVQQAHCVDYGCSLPATIHAGWSVCITGIPTDISE